MRKSQFVQFLLTFFFGPLGLFYSSVAAAVGFLIAAILFGAFTAGVGAFVIWPITIIVGFVTVSNHNKKALQDAVRHSELVKAARESGKSEG